MKNSVRLPAFAKVNLCLHVLGRRADGYHELRTIFQAISLHDTLELTRTRQPGITLEIERSVACRPGAENLVYRAMRRWRGASWVSVAGIRARLRSAFRWREGSAAGRAMRRAALMGMLRLTGRRSCRLRG